MDKQLVEIESVAAAELQMRKEFDTEAYVPGALKCLCLEYIVVTAEFECERGAGEDIRMDHGQTQFVFKVDGYFKEVFVLGEGFV